MRHSRLNFEPVTSKQFSPIATRILLFLNRYTANTGYSHDLLTQKCTLFLSTLQETRPYPTKVAGRIMSGSTMSPISFAAADGEWEML